MEASGNVDVYVVVTKDYDVEVGYVHYHNKAPPFLQIGPKLRQFSDSVT